MLLLYILFAVILIAGLYAFCVFPSLKKPDCTRLTGWNYAHRGFHDNAGGPPENTLAAFENAVIMGYGIELDVWLSTDGVLVVHHDATLSRSCGDKRRVSDCTARELSTQKLFGLDYGVPSFAKVLKTVDGQVPIIIEIKDESFKTDTVMALRDALKTYRGAYCIESFNPVQGMHVRRLMPEAIRGQLSTDFIADKSRKGRITSFILGNMLLNFLSRPHFIAYGYRYANRLSFRICALLCAFTAAWTVKSAAAFKRASKWFNVIIFEGFAPDNKRR